jgi:hypothetical protein
LLKYVLRRHFEYITIKTPILSLLLAFITFAVVFFIAQHAITYEYTHVDAKILVSENKRIIFIADVPDDFAYDTEYATAFTAAENIDQMLRLVLLDDQKEDGKRRLYFILPDPQPKDIDLPDETVLEIVSDRITLTERIFGNFKK